MSDLKQSEMETEQEFLEWLVSQEGQEFLVSQGLTFGIVN